MHQHFAGVDRDDLELRAFEGRALNARSHGEGFLAFLESRRFERGLYLLDEPEAALSFRSCLSLIALLGDAIAAGSQVVMATHLPCWRHFRTPDCCSSITRESPRRRTTTGVWCATGVNSSPAPAGSCVT